MTSKPLLSTALVFALGCAMSQAAPAATPSPGSKAKASATGATAAPATSKAARSDALPTVLVHKSPTCGCCNGWVAHLRESGFEVKVHDSDDLNPIKAKAGVPAGKASCHTAEVGGYFIEGHVPADDIVRLLTEKPKIKGLVLPGMPSGSPGMERPDGRKMAFTVEQVALDGKVSDYARH